MLFRSAGSNNGSAKGSNKAGGDENEEIDTSTPEGKLKEYKNKMADFITSEYTAVKERMTANEGGIENITIVFKTEEEKMEIVK